MTEKCISCELTIDDIIKEYGQDTIEEGYPLEKGFLCYPCAEYDLAEAPLTVYHNRNEYPKRIGQIIMGVLIGVIVYLLSTYVLPQIV